MNNLREIKTCECEDFLQIMGINADKSNCFLVTLFIIITIQSFMIFCGQSIILFYNALKIA